MKGIIISAVAFVYEASLVHQSPLVPTEDPEQISAIILSLYWLLRN